MHMRMMIILWLLIAGIVSFGIEGIRQPKILVISSFHLSHPWTKAVCEEISNEFVNSDKGYIVEFLELNSMRNRQADFSAKFQPSLKKLQQGEYDMAVAILDDACDLIDQNYDSLPKDLPILFCCGRQMISEYRKTHPNIAGFTSQLRVEETIQLALKLYPDSKNIAVIYDDIPSGRLVGERSFRIFGSVHTRELILIGGEQYTTSQMLEKVKSLPPDTIVVFAPWRNFTKDGYLSLEQIGEELSSNTPKPYFVLTDVLMGYGALGGVVSFGPGQGQALTTMMHKILDGESISAIPVQPMPTRCMIDMELFRRAKLDESKLPGSAILLNQKIPFYREYLKTVLVVGSVSLLLVIALVVIIVMYIRHVRSTRMNMMIFKTLPVRIAIIDRDGDILFLQDGSDQGIFAGKDRTLRNIMESDPNTAGVLREAIAQVLGSGKSQTFQYPYKGTTRYAVCVPCPRDLFDKDCVLWISRDVSELVNTRITAETLAEQLRTTLNSIGDGLFVTDKNELVTMANPMAEKLTGRCALEMLGRPLQEVFDVVSRTDGGRREAPIHSALESGKVCGFAEPMDMISADGTVRHIADSAAPIRNRDGEITGAVLVFRDVSKELAQQKELAMANYTKTMIFNNIKVPILLFDGEGTLMNVNPAACAMAQRTREAILNCSCNNSFCGCKDTPSFCPVRKTLASGLPASVELTFHGREFFLTADPVFGEDDRIMYVIESALDVTEINEHKRKLIEAAKAAQSADRAKSNFIATMSHELRTPLNAVIGFSELLKSGEVDRGKQLEYLDAINLAGNTLLELINDVLDLSKLDAVELTLQPGKIDLHGLLNEIVAIFKYRIQDKGLYLNLELPERLPHLVLDSLRLRQILLNLIGNATKFTHRGGIYVKVAVVPADERLCELRISVTDSGIGMPPETVARVFEPFFQDEGVRGSRAYQGSGLGLAIALRLARAMGGELSVESTEKIGSTFVLTIPGVPYVCEERKVELPVATAELQPHAAERILVVDDVALNLKVLASMLNKIGFECVCAGSGREALEQIEKQEFSAVLTDMWMPEMNGEALAGEIRRRYPEHAMRIFAVTADVEWRESGSEKLFDKTLYKPLTLKVLREALA